MGKAEYDMFQEIPAKENGSTNLCNGIAYDCFYSYLKSQLARQYQKLNDYDTPTKVYILYDKSYPIGYIGIRTKINKKWRNWCENIYYAIRPSERLKHLGTKMLSLVIKECEKLNINPIYIKSASGNIGSQKIIENNNGVLIREGQHGGRWYKIQL